MTNKQIARVLRETGALIELTGGNAFRARAYQNAALTVDRLEEPVSDIAARGELDKVNRIGTAMAAQIVDLLERGSFDQLDELIAAVPPGLMEVLRVKGIGAKKARTLWQSLDITSLEELEEAATIGRLADLPGFGKKTQETILQSVRQYREYRAHRRYAEAVSIAEPMLNTIRSAQGVEAASITGDLRRAMETVSGAEFVIGAADLDLATTGLLETLPLEETSRSKDEVVLAGALNDGLAANLIIVPLEEFGSTLWRTTGSTEHCTRFIEEYGSPASARDEKSVYASAGLPVIPPELRENRGELEAAAAGVLPNLIRVEDLRGVLHNHSTYSDGVHTLRQMAEAVRARGFSYFGICDHSQSLTIANGLSIERVREQQDEIRALNDEFASDGGSRFRIFSGIESDILADGSLDYPDDVLASFDFVVASVHSRFNMTEEEGTERLIRAVTNPYTTILGHATGRLLLTRSGYPIDHERVIEACAEAGTAIEINANPRRLDMDWRWLRSATDRGVLISINPDAHSIEELDYVRWGVAAARKGWLTATQCLNALDLDEIDTWFEARRKSAGSLRP